MFHFLYVFECIIIFKHIFISTQETSTNQKKSGPEYRFTFDFGPSWYWMPDLFDAIYERFGGRKVSEFYERRLLDPAYRIYHSNSSFSDNSSEEGSFSILAINIFLL